MRNTTISTYFDILSKSQKIYARQLEPVCRKWELTRNEMDILLFLYNNPEYNRAADIVARRGIAKSHVSMAVASLEGRGLLERQFSPSDRRTAHLHLTSPGTHIAAEGRVAQQAFFDLLYTGVEEEQLRIWEQVSRKVQRNIDQLDKSVKE